MIAVTGAFGFIGSHLTKRIRRKYPQELIVVVDDLERGEKILNLSGVPVDIFVDYRDFLGRFAGGDFSQLRIIFHQGAHCDTTEKDGRVVMSQNYDYTVKLIDLCQQKRIPLIYASSAAVYGNGEAFFESDDNEAPLNVYAYSKYMVDQYAKQIFKKESFSPLVSLRYFNVYGSGEDFKGSMSSVVFKQIRDFKEFGRIRIFGDGAGCRSGEHLRDFVSIDDVIDVNLFFLEELVHRMRFSKYWSGFSQLSDSQRESITQYENWRIWKICEGDFITESQRRFWEANKIQLEFAFYDWQKWLKFSKGGIYNVGTGNAVSFNDLALVLLEFLTGESYSLNDAISKGLIEYIKFPEGLEKHYQSYTQADLCMLRAAGYSSSFKDLKTGVYDAFRLKKLD